MTSPSAARLGERLPRVRSVPDYAYSDGLDAIELAASAGVLLDGWQQDWLTESLGVRADGRWSAFEVAGVVARQNGKGEVLLARELAGLFLFGERLILHSAHLYPTAQEAFLRIRSVVENCDDLRRQVKAVRNANGEQGIELLNGNRLRFVARSKGSGRGFTGDCIILDEAYDLGASAMAALLPTLSSRPNPQLWYASSAGMESSEQLNTVRARGLTGSDPSLCYLEWSAPEGADPEDPHSVAMANPALGIRIPYDFVENERRTMPVEEFARERLSIWSNPRTESVIPMDKWDALADPMQRDPDGTPIVGTGSVPIGRVVLALDVPPDRSGISIAAAGERADKRTHLELVEKSSLDGAPRRIAELVRRHNPRTVVLDPGSASGSLIPELTAMGVRLTLVSMREYGQACGALYDATVAGTLAHLDQLPLNLALLAAKKRTLGDAWAWDRKDSTDISPLVAVTLAKHGLDVALAARRDITANVW